MSGETNVREVFDFVKERLDEDYVRQTAGAVAAALRGQGEPIGVAFQPGDGTRYDLVFVPVQNLRHAPGRVKNGETWGAAPELGISREPGTALVSWPRHGAIGLDLRTGGFEPVYLLELFDTTLGSACTLAILFEAIAEALRG